jgi:hypothetical protein
MVLRPASIKYSEKIRWWSGSEHRCGMTNRGALMRNKRVACAIMPVRRTTRSGPPSTPRRSTASTST